MKDTLRWSYAINAWNLRMDVFVRHEEQQRALKTLSALGFDHVELASGMGGRWENLGTPEIILINHGSAEGLLAFLRRAGISGVSSWCWDPGQPAEETGYAFLMTRNPADHDAIVEAAKPFVDLLAAAGGDQLVVRPAGSAWMAPPLGDGDAGIVGSLWNRVGEVAAAAGVGVSLHYDCLQPFHTEEQLVSLLDATDPALVGLALDTAELTIGGIDPVAFYDAHHGRVTHVQLKDTRFQDAGQEYLTPGAEATMLKGGAGRRIERWFYELGTEGGLVDVEAFVASLRAHGYGGWVVVEGDRGGNATEVAMLNSWFLQRRLGVEKV